MSRAVGRGAQLMLGVAPDTRGLLPDSDVLRLNEFGAAIHSLQTGNLALQHLPTTPEAAAALDGNTDTFWSAPPWLSPFHVGGQPGQTSRHRPGHVDGMARRRPTRREICGRGMGRAKGWKTVASGQAIGHEKIDRFTPVIASRIRLNILSSSQEAHIREFQVYSDAPPDKVKPEAKSSD